MVLIVQLPKTSSVVRWSLMGLAKRKYVDLLESDDSLEELPAFTLKEEPQNDSPAQKYLAFILKY